MPTSREWSIPKKIYAHDIDLHLLFIDFKRAFDSINQKRLLETLVSFGIPKKIEQLVRMTLEGAQAKVIVDGKISTLFNIDTGVRQGDGLSATLFNLVLQKPWKNWIKTKRFWTDLWICWWYLGNRKEPPSSQSTAWLAKKRSRQSGPGNKPWQDQVYEIFNIPIPKISERVNYKWCNLWRSSWVYIPGNATQ